jgi:hypothetical protein
MKLDTMNNGRRRRRRSIFEVVVSAKSRNEKMKSRRFDGRRRGSRVTLRNSKLAVLRNRIQMYANSARRNDIVAQKRPARSILGDHRNLKGPARVLQHLIWKDRKFISAV